MRSIAPRCRALCVPRSARRASGRLRNALVVRCEPNDKDGLKEKNHVDPKLLKETVEELREKMDRETAQELLKLWKEEGINIDNPEEIEEAFASVPGPSFRFGVQLVLDLIAGYAAYQASTAISNGDDFFGRGVIVFIFSAVTFNYVLAFFGNITSLWLSIRAQNRVSANAAVYIEAVKKIAGPSAVSTLEGIQGAPKFPQGAIDSLKIARSLEKMDAFLKEKASKSERMATAESLGVYLTLNRAREQQGFTPEKFGITEEDATTIARMFSKYDKNDDGRIDQSELEELCRDAGRSLTIAEVKAALKAIDENGNGYIEFGEFVAFWTNADAKVAAVRAAQGSSDAEAGAQAKPAGDSSS